MKHAAPPDLTPERIMQLSWGYAPPLIIEAAVRNRFFDLLRESPKNARRLAKASGVPERGVTAVCDALVGLRLLARNRGDYRLTPESAAFLVSGGPAFHGGFFHQISSHLIPNWLALSEVVRTGKCVAPVNSERKGAQFFAKFVESIFPLSYAAAKALGAHLGIPDAKTPFSVLDLAAGSGVWHRARGTVFSSSCQRGGLAAGFGGDGKSRAASWCRRSAE
jgi:hypothetical protein